MRKILYFVLLLLMSSGNLSAQVSIGSEDGPRPGAGLDLNSKTKGLLLPNVSLSAPATEFQLSGGDPATASGMLVYNTSDDLDGPGVYVWDGSKWILNTCVPATPTGITFSKTANIKLDETITATATPEVTFGNAKPNHYNWTIPDNYFEILDSENTRVIKLKAKAAGSSITGTIKVNAENACDKSADYSNTTALNILDCSDVPATPGTIEFSATTVNLTGMFTASVPEVTTGTQIPTSYTWTLPSGLTGSSTSRSITITGATAGTYAVGEIQVTATNVCGTSAAQSNASAVTVHPCTAAPTISSPVADETKITKVNVELLSELSIT
ncbi:MAG: hypothetical protein LBG15_13695, partial [Dysgonamonadaceae bacterium]|nr:hypothetical protein [Dysgonamonadaceae bacterium]